MKCRVTLLIYGDPDGEWGTEEHVYDLADAVDGQDATSQAVNLAVGMGLIELGEGKIAEISVYVVWFVDKVFVPRFTSWRVREYGPLFILIGLDNSFRLAILKSSYVRRQLTDKTVNSRKIVRHPPRRSNKN